MKKKLFSVLGVTTFASLSLSLSLSTSINKTQNTALNSITKINLTDLFPDSTPMGQFKADPTIETLLSRAKDIDSDFHNENPSWYTITNRDSFGCTLSANQTNPYYIGSFNPGYSINPTNKIELSSIFPTSQLYSALNNKIFLNGGNNNPNDTLNQINDFFKERGYGTDLSLNQITANYTTYGGEYGDGVITLSATNSLIYSGSVSIPYTNNFAPTNMTSNTTLPYETSASSVWGSASTDRWEPWNCFSLGTAGNTGWCIVNPPAIGHWIKISLDKPYSLKKYQIAPSNQSYINDNERLAGWNIQGSNDGETWDDLDERINQGYTWTGLTYNSYYPNIINNNAYSEYRLYITQNNPVPGSDGLFDIWKIKFFGTV